MYSLCLRGFFSLHGAPLKMKWQLHKCTYLLGQFVSAEYTVSRGTLIVSSLPDAFQGVAYYV